MFVDRLPEGVTLRLYLRLQGEERASWKILFSSSKKWLHPLFELEEFLASHARGGNRDGRAFEFDGGLSASSSDLFLRDKTIGMAAAFLVVRMGIRAVETDRVSRRALHILKENAVAIETLETVDAIACMTEKILKDKTDPEEVYGMLAERRAKAMDR